MVRCRFIHSLWRKRLLALLLGVTALNALSGCANSRSGQRSLTAKSSRDAVGGAKKSAASKNGGQALTRSDGTGQSDVELVSREVADAQSEGEINLPSPPMVGDGSSPQALAGRALTLEELETLAIQNNPTLAQAQAGLYPNPQVGYLNGTASDPRVKQSNGIFLSQEFVTAKKLDLDQAAAAQEIKKTEWDREAQCMRVRNDLKIRYYEALGAQEAVAVAQKLVKIAEASLAASERLFTSKQGTRADILQAKIQLETVRLTLDDAQYRYVAAWEQLAAMIGTSPIQPFPLAGELASDIPELDLETCWQDLVSRSPQLRSAESELDHGWAVYRLSRAQAIPNVTLQSVIDYDKATQATTASTLIAFPFPIYNRNQGNIDKAFADIQADQAEISRVRLVLRDQLAESFRRYKTSLRQTERLKQGILPNTEENLKLATQLHTAGETAFTPVLLAQQAYFESQIAYVEALTEVHKVATEIQGLQLTGGLNPAAIGSAIQNQPGGTSQRQRALLKEVQDRASKQLLPAAQIGQ
jgi:cobalt-zinc-cadmium efflux system outer membrane protein